MNWGDHSSGEPGQHQPDEECPVNAEAVRGQQAIQISRCKEFFLVPFPQDLVTHVSKQQSIENFQTFYFVMKMKASDNLNQVKLSARAHSNFQTSLLSEDGGRFKKMEGEGGEGVMPIYIYSTIVIWLNIVMYDRTLVCFLIYFTIPNIK